MHRRTGVGPIARRGGNSLKRAGAAWARVRYSLADGAPWGSQKYDSADDFVDVAGGVCLVPLGTASEKQCPTIFYFYPFSQKLVSKQ